MAAKATVRVLALAGSVRRGSFNARLLELAVAGAEAAGATVVTLDLAQYTLPIYDSDFEAGHGLPEPARQLKGMLRAHAGLLIASPEYNGSMPPLLLNAFAWAARPEAGEERGDVFKGKAAGLLSASPETLGGMRGLAQLSAVLGNLGVLVVPYPISVPDAAHAFAAEGGLVDKKLEARVRGIGEAVAQQAAKIRT
jgi:NAD(P)H-dependent FMN reductase